MLQKELKIVEQFFETVKKQHRKRLSEDNISTTRVHNIPTSIINTAKIYPHCGTKGNLSKDQSWGSDADSESVYISSGQKIEKSEELRAGDVIMYYNEVCVTMEYLVTRLNINNSLFRLSVQNIVYIY